MIKDKDKIYVKTIYIFNLFLKTDIFLFLIYIVILKNDISFFSFGRKMSLASFITQVLTDLSWKWS